MKNISAVIYGLFIITLSLFTFLPLLNSGFFNFHDNTQVVRVFEMGNSLSSGMFPVRWIDGLGYGYGYPIFNFYGPLPYYIGGILSLVGFDALFATKTMFFVGIVLSGISMFVFARRIFGEIAGTVCGILYAYFPYHAVNIYVRGAVGEFFAYAFLPIFLLGIFGLMQSEQKSVISPKNITNILVVAWGLFLVAISHNLTLFMLLLLCIPLLCAITIVAKNKKVFFISALIGLLLGIALSAFYVFPAFLEMKYTNVSSQIGGGADFRDHFVCASQYWNSLWGYGGSVKGCVDGLSFKLGKFNILLFVSSLIFLCISIYRRNWKKAEKIAMIAFILSVISMFFTLEISQTVWEAIPYMLYLQYPWRFINFIGISMILVIGYMTARIGELFPRKIVLIAATVIIVMTILSSYKLFVPQQYVNFPSQFYVNDNYIKFTVSKISDEYMPPSFSVPRSAGEVPSRELFSINSHENVEVLTNKVNYLKSSFEMEKDGVLHINKAYFPAWKAYENGTEIPIVPTHNGMNVSLHSGKGIFELKFRQTNIEIIANIVSVLAFLLSVVSISKAYLRANYRKKTV